LILRTSLGLILVCCAAGGGRVVPYQPLDIKLGQWEVTARVDVQQGWTTHGPGKKVFKGCLTTVEEPWKIVVPRELDEQVQKLGLLPSKSCLEKLSVSSSSRQEKHVDCQTWNMVYRIKAKDPENVKGFLSIRSTSVSSKPDQFHPVSFLDVPFTAKWLRPDCSN